MAVPTLGELTLELAIGEDPEATHEYEFSAIVSLMVDRERRLWVVDGDPSYGSDQSPAIRIFDIDGTYVRNVGGEGSGPGEYRAPSYLAQLLDGRVVLRDAAIPDRITVYHPDGSFDTTWSVPVSVRSASAAIHVDTSGVVWLPFRAGARPGPQASDVRYLRVRDGVVLDTVRPPPIPETNEASITVRGRTPSGGTSVRGVIVPYKPVGFRAWHPFGGFAIGRTDVYRIEVVRPPDVLHGSDALMDALTRNPDPVAVPEAERADMRNEIVAELQELNAADRDVPEISTHKPPLKAVNTTPDGHLWVSVAMPSVYREGVWDEPAAFDVFHPSGQYRGRLVLPDSVMRIMPAGSDHVWAVWRGQFDVQSIRRYAVSWH